MASELDPAIAAHYRHDPERDRLETWARLEGIRTRELLSRFLPQAPAVVLDIGGARGAYALPLAQEGYEVHLIDPYMPHVEAAMAASAAQPDAPLASVAVGDARELPLRTRARMRYCSSVRFITCQQPTIAHTHSLKRVVCCAAEVCCSPPVSPALLRRLRVCAWD